MSTRYRNRSNLRQALATLDNLKDPETPVTLGVLFEILSDDKEILMRVEVSKNSLKASILEANSNDPPIREVLTSDVSEVREWVIDMHKRYI